MPPGAKSPLWGTRVAAVLSLLLLFLGVVLAGLRGGFGGAIVVALWLSPLWVLLLVALARLESKKVREAARITVFVAVLGLLGAVLGLIAGASQSNAAIFVLAGILGVMQLAMGISAGFLIRAMPVPVPPPAALADPRWLKRVQALALLSLAATLGPIAGLSVAKAISEGAQWLLAIVITAPAWGWYAAIWSRLRGPKQKQGLAIAITIGIVGLLLGGLMTAVLLAASAGPWVTATPGAFVLIQAGMVAASIRTYYTMPREPGDRSLLANWLGGSFVYGFIVLVVAAIYVPGTLVSRRAANESSAVGSLRSIVTAAVAYDTNYGHGFPPALSLLGPPAEGEEPNCRAAGLLDFMLASGEKSGYRFEYHAEAPAGSAAPGCPKGSASFTVVAIPISHNRTGTRSFFTDQSGVIRATQEDRRATANDPPHE